MQDNNEQDNNQQDNNQSENQIEKPDHSSEDQPDSQPTQSAKNLDEEQGSEPIENSNGDESSGDQFPLKPILAIVGVVVLLSLMIWTWRAFYGDAGGKKADEQTLIEIQDNLQDQIYRILLEWNDTVRNVEFDKFWTEQLESGHVVAHFVVSFDEPVGDEGETIRVEREGSITLEKLGETPDEQVWSALKVDVGGEDINFQRGLKFKAGEESAEMGEVTEEGNDVDTAAQETSDEGQMNNFAEDKMPESEALKDEVEEQATQQESPAPEKAEPVKSEAPVKPEASTESDNVEVQSAAPSQTDQDSDSNLEIESESTGSDTQTESQSDVDTTEEKL